MFDITRGRLIENVKINHNVGDSHVMRAKPKAGQEELLKDLALRQPNLQLVLRALSKAEISYRSSTTEAGWVL